MIETVCLKVNAPQREWHSWECDLVGMGMILLVEVCHMKEVFGFSRNHPVSHITSCCLKSRCKTHGYFSSVLSDCVPPRHVVMIMK